MEEDIKKLYNQFHVGPNKIYYFLRSKYPDITINDIKDVLDEDEIYQIYKQKRQVKNYVKTSSYRIFEVFECDIIDMKSLNFDPTDYKEDDESYYVLKKIREEQKEEEEGKYKHTAKSKKLYIHNDGYKFIFLYIDTFSKYIFCYPSTNEDAKTTVEITETFIEECRKLYKNVNTIKVVPIKDWNRSQSELNINTGKQIDNKLYDNLELPKILKTDYGKNFTSNAFNELMEKYDIKHYCIFHAYNAERAIRTIKNMLIKSMFYNKTFTWINKLADIVNFYNNSWHRSINMTPYQAIFKLNEMLVYKNLYPQIYLDEKHEYIEQTEPKYQVGDVVRILRPKKLFEKMTPNYTIKTYKIIKVLNTFPYLYKVERIAKTGKKKKLREVFYENELIKVSD